MSNIRAGDRLNMVNYPSDLRLLPEDSLLDFCNELRDYIIEHCSIHGGHFGASLGVVELTVALHYVFNTPHDLLVWDVGHQAYGHKLITGRRAHFHTNRIYGGVSGFPKRAESEYDAFGVGHSSTSISAALGMAVATERLNETPRRKTVAIIGDGALTGGLAFEGLNNAGAMDADLLVVLNDNCMSIDPNVGALKEYLIDVTTSRTYNRLRDEVWRQLGKLKAVGVNIDAARAYAAKLEDVFTTALFKPGMFFEAMGFRYFGPIDGHEVNHLVRILRDLKEIKGPKLLHIVTVKGKGFAPAEADQTKWHAPAFNFDKITGQASAVVHAPKPTPPKFQDVFGETLIEMARQNEKIVAVTPAMLSGSGLVKMKALMPDRCFDVGIAEQHAVTFSAGLATQGIIPFCNIYSTFLQRGYDQLVHDVVIQDLKVIFCLDRAGLVGADGATHHGCYDIAYLRALPNIIVSAPMDETELRNLMFTAAAPEQKKSFSIRYPRGNGTALEWRTPLEILEIGKGRLLTEGQDLAILSIGTAGVLAAKAVALLQNEGIYPAHYDMRFVKPLDGEILDEVYRRFKYIITVEDGCLPGGFGSAVLEWAADNGRFAQVKRLGIPDRVVHHGTQAELYAECRYDAAAIVQTARALLAEKIAAF